MLLQGGQVLEGQHFPRMHAPPALSVQVTKPRCRSYPTKEGWGWEFHPENAQGMAFLEERHRPRGLVA